MKRSSKFRIIAIVLSILLLVMAGCGAPEKDAATATAPLAPSATIEAPSKSAELNQQYFNQQLMLEMLVNDSCEVTYNNNIVTVLSPRADGSHAIQINISCLPGVQNLAHGAQAMAEAVTRTYGESEVPVEPFAGYLMGGRAVIFTFSGMLDDQLIGGVCGVGVMNQSLYVAEGIFTHDATQEEINLLSDLMVGLNVIQPVAVDAESKKAQYQPKHVGKKKARQSSDPPEDWAYLPYYYYGEWWETDSVDLMKSAMYDPYFYEPDWDYYSGTNAYWSWEWDDADDWAFADDYGSYYDTSAYEASEDYYENYDYNAYYFGDSGDTDGYVGESDSGDYSGDWGDYDPSDYGDSDEEYSGDYGDYSGDYGDGDVDGDW